MAEIDATYPGFLAFEDIWFFCITGREWSHRLQAHNNFPKGKVYTQK